MIHGETLESLHSVYAQEGYHVPSFVGIADEVSDVSAYPPITRVGSDAYYSKRGIGISDVLTIADDMPSQVERLHGLTIESRLRFFRSAYWYYQSSVAWAHSLSAAFVAVINAIESLVPVSPAQGKCSQCGKDLGEGPHGDSLGFSKKPFPFLRKTKKSEIESTCTPFEVGWRMARASLGQM